MNLSRVGAKDSGSQYSKRFGLSLGLRRGVSTGMERAPVVQQTGLTMCVEETRYAGEPKVVRTSALLL